MSAKLARLSSAAKLVSEQFRELLRDPTMIFRWEEMKNTITETFSEIYLDHDLILHVTEDGGVCRRRIFLVFKFNSMSEEDKNRNLLKRFLN